ncbi:ADP-ribosylation [Mycena epipterygia]|nr:ADP-ribosylation [Mycena epipterygia]
MIFHIKGPVNWKKKKTARLVALNPRDPTYTQLEKHFQDGWKHPKKPKPHVHAIFEIVLTEESLVSFLRYRALVELSRVSRHANEQLLFHGTNQRCLLGDARQRTRLCNIPECLLCSVIRNSFDVENCGKRHKFRRFGKGIYTTACSSKADDYFRGLPDSPFRAVLVNRVVVGNPLNRKSNDEELTEPPDGYHSVVGVPGGDLNYGETVVYRNDAIRPAYLIVYATNRPPEIHTDLKSMISTLFTTPIAS